MRNNFQVSDHFNLREFECPCCGAVALDTELLAKLELLRTRYGRPIKVTSGYRCWLHNREVGGITRSKHLTGEAADITPVKGPLNELVALATAILEDVDIVPYWDRNFVHIELRKKGGDV